MTTPLMMLGPGGDYVTRFDVKGQGLVKTRTQQSAGHDPDAPTARSGGKARAVQTLIDEYGYDTVVMIGDGVTDAEGRVLALPAPPPDERVLTEPLAARLREMMVATTERGTARKAFRVRRGRPLLQGISVAGKTGSLNGEDPDGRYEWFIGLAPAEDPRVVVATVAVQGPLYWMSASQMGAEVLKSLFCPEGVCAVEALRGIRDAPALAKAE